MNVTLPISSSNVPLEEDRSVSLLGLGTAVPKHVLLQDEVQKNAERLFADRYPDFERLSKSFETSGVKKRYSVVPFEWFDEPRNWPERTAAYLEGATELFKNSTLAALETSGLRADEIDAIVTVSSTGITTPTLEARTLFELSFRDNVQRVPLFGLGCAGGVTGLSVATRLARSQPGKKILMVAVETCSLAFRTDRLKKADIIATILFGDGAAAAIVECGGEGAGPTLGEGYEHSWPDTLSIMGWDVDKDGFGVVFDRSIPAFAKDHFLNALLSAYRASGFLSDDISRLVCHPGGAKVLEAFECALGFESGHFDHERTVLKEYGNMSAPTALFVLDEVKRHEPKGQMMLAALGPGFTASFLPIKF